MKFFLSDKTVDSFEPRDLLNLDTRNEFQNALDSVGIAGETYGKYCEALTAMIKKAQNTVSFSGRQWLNAVRRLPEGNQNSCLPLDKENKTKTNCAIYNDELILQKNESNYNHLKTKAVKNNKIRQN